MRTAAVVDAANWIRMELVSHLWFALRAFRSYKNRTPADGQDWANCMRCNQRRICQIGENAMNTDELLYKIEKTGSPEFLGPLQRDCSMPCHRKAKELFGALIILGGEMGVPKLRWDSRTKG